MRVVVAEKPSVARDIARVLKVSKKSDGFVSGKYLRKETIVTWCLGHLVGLCDPGEMDAAWKRWSEDQLPILPPKWKLKSITRTKKQLSVLTRLLKNPKVTEIVCATDAGREGELIFRLLMLHLKCKLPFKRLWISSLTDDAISRGFNNLAASSDYDNLFHSAFARAKADWLVGMNFSRYYSLRLGSNFSVGRVQTPTLKLIVDRELLIREFQPEKYFLIEGVFGKVSEVGEYTGKLRVALDKIPHALNDYTEQYKRLRGSENDGQRSQQRTTDKIPPVAKIFDYYKARAEKGDVRISSLDEERKHEKPHLLYDLNELQRDANKIYGYSASETLSLAQKLYEKFKVITYPRSDSRYLTKDMVSQLPRVVSAIKGQYQAELSRLNLKSNIPSRFINNSKVSDHHAIIPTGKISGLRGLRGKERNVFDLICRRFLMAFLEDHVYTEVRIVTSIKYSGVEDFYFTKCKSIVSNGWKDLYLNFSKKEKLEQTIPGWVTQLEKDLTANLIKSDKETTAPKRYTDASLLTAMENAGNLIAEKQLSDQIKGIGIGTPATRASIIENLLARGYVERKGKSFFSLSKGETLISAVADQLACPSLTAEWERSLDEILQARLSPNEFESNICKLISSLLTHRKQIKPKEGLASEKIAEIKKEREKGKYFNDPKLFEHAKKYLLGEKSLKPEQARAVKHLSMGRDVFCILPTGFGKSLIYQLSGLERGGKVLVISPLISLMHDQVESLKKLQIDARYLSSARSIEQNEQDIDAFLHGDCSFLFVSPEKASQLCFIEKITRNKLSLLVFDEAHCISLWGDDFRPKYKKLSRLVKAVRPTPACLLSATIKPKVKSEILKTLDINCVEEVVLHQIPNNLFIDVKRVKLEERLSELSQILEKDENKPAIVYVPSRSLAEKVCEHLSCLGVTTFYHAGLDQSKKAIIHKAFIEDKVDVVVATIAFGMGINKLNVRSIIHYITPLSVEAYVQEIGRAGRDKLRATVSLFFHEDDKVALHKRFNYHHPEVTELKKFLTASRSYNFGELSQKEKRIIPHLEEYALVTLRKNKVNINQGNQTEWQTKYQVKRQSKLDALERIFAFLDEDGCRKNYLHNYFSDSSSEKPCGMCDVCGGATSQSHSPAPHYLKMLHNFIAQNNGLSTNMIYQSFAKPAGLGKTQYRGLIRELVKRKNVCLEKKLTKVGSRKISTEVVSCI